MIKNINKKFALFFMLASLSAVTISQVQQEEATIPLHCLIEESKSELASYLKIKTIYIRDNFNNYLGDSYDEPAFQFVQNLFAKIKTHPDFDEKILSGDIVDSLDWMIYKTLKTVENKDEDREKLLNLLEYINEPTFESKLYEKHEEEFGPIKYRPTRGLPTYLSPKECFLQAQKAQTVYSPEIAEQVTDTKTLHAAKSLFDVYDACIRRTEENREEIILLARYKKLLERLEK